MLVAVATDVARLRGGNAVERYVISNSYDTQRKGDEQKEATRKGGACTLPFFVATTKRSRQHCA